MKHRYPGKPSRAIPVACRLAVLPVALLLSLFAGACGGDGKDHSPKKGKLNTEVDPSTLAGLAPLQVHFATKVLRATGKVTYHWSFGDGATSNQQSPIHTYKKPEFFSVQMRAKDEAGNEDRWGLVLRAYTQKEHDRAKSRNPADVIKGSAKTYYTKYPQSLPADPDSGYYRNFPYLKPILKRYVVTERAFRSYSKTPAVLPTDLGNTLYRWAPRLKPLGRQQREKYLAHQRELRSKER